MRPVRKATKAEKAAAMTPAFARAKLAHQSHAKGFVRCPADEAFYLEAPYTPQPSLAQPRQAHKFAK